MFRLLYSLLLVPAWSLVMVKNLNYNYNKEYGNISINFTEADGVPEVSCNFSIFNDVPKGWVILQTPQKIPTKTLLFSSQIKAKVEVVKEHFTVIDTTINICTVGGRFAPNALVKMIIERIKQFTNLTFGCPYRKVSFL
jgi:hypothetical protein